MRKILFGLVGLLSQFVYAQNSDCNSAILLTDTLYVQSKTPLGFGKIKELVQPKNYDSTSFKIEKNSTWFIIQNPFKASLTFTIKPEYLNDDYDFMLFDMSSNSFCDTIKIAGKYPSLRSNISRNDKKINSITGLKNIGETEHVGIGLGNSFCKPLTIDANKKYMLVVCSDRNPQKGFTLSLNYEKLKASSAQSDSLLALIEAELKKSRNKLEVKFIDSETKLPIESNVMVKNLMVDTGFVISGFSSYTIPFKSQTDIMPIAPGYLIEKKNYTPLADSLSLVDTVFLKKITKDAYLSLLPFYFEGNTDKLLPKSKPALNALLLFLKENPSVKIQIEGHANGPNQKNLKEFKRLSERRAEAIKKYLMFEGISKKKLTVEGFGNAMMIYPEPQTDEQSELNRRVEIKVIELD